MGGSPRESVILKPTHHTPTKPHFTQAWRIGTKGPVIWHQTRPRSEWPSHLLTKAPKCRKGFVLRKGWQQNSIGKRGFQTTKATPNKSQVQSSQVAHKLFLVNGLDFCAVWILPRCFWWLLWCVKKLFTPFSPPKYGKLPHSWDEETFTLLVLIFLGHRVKWLLTSNWLQQEKPVA